MQGFKKCGSMGACRNEPMLRQLEPVKRVLRCCSSDRLGHPGDYFLCALDQVHEL